MTSNQYYGGLNRRFEKRSALLRSVGFRYVSLPDYCLAVFCRNPMMRIRHDTVSAEFVMHATKRDWIDRLSSLLSRSR